MSVILTDLPDTLAGRFFQGKDTGFPSMDFDLQRAAGAEDFFSGVIIRETFDNNTAVLGTFDDNSAFYHGRLAHEAGR